MSEAKKFTIGQSVWVAPIDRHSLLTGRACTITKIARKWMTLDNGRRRFDAETMTIDPGEYSPSEQVYLSRADWENERNLESAWSSLQSALRQQFRIPQDLTIKDICKARKILKLDKR